jgi:hypothetical protein
MLIYYESKVIKSFKFKYSPDYKLHFLRSFTITDLSMNQLSASEKNIFRTKECD